MATTITYKGSDLTSFSNTSKTLRTAGKYLEGDITITAGLDVNNQNKTVIPSEASQSITADTGYTGLGTVTVNGITNTYVGSSVPVNTSLTVSANTITASAGYYTDAVTYTMPYATAKTITLSAHTPTISIDDSGLITSRTSSKAFTTGDFIESPGYIKIGVASLRVACPSGVTTTQLDTQAATTVIPSESTTTITGQKYMTGDITVEAITPTYVGSEVPTGSLTVSGSTVTASAGYYADAATKTIPNASLITEKTISAGAIQSSVDNTGLITTKLNSSAESFRVSQNNGYIEYANSTISISIPARTTTYQLPTLPAQSFTPSSATQTVASTGKYMLGDITVEPIPSQYIVPSGTLTISSVDTTTTFDATSYASVNVNLKNADVTAY